MKGYEKLVKQAIKVQSCAEAIESLIEELPKLAKILDNADANDFSVIVDKLDDLYNLLPDVHLKVYEAVGTLSDGRLKGIAFCNLCEKVVVDGIDKYHKELADTVFCDTCRKGLSEEEIKEEEEEESITEIAQQLKDRLGSVDEVLAAVEKLTKLHHVWAEDINNDAIWDQALNALDDLTYLVQGE